MFGHFRRDMTKMRNGLENGLANRLEGTCLKRSLSHRNPLYSEHTTWNKHLNTLSSHIKLCDYRSHYLLGFRGLVNCCNSWSSVLQVTAGLPCCSCRVVFNQGQGSGYYKSVLLVCWKLLTALTDNLAAVNTSKQVLGKVSQNWMVACTLRCLVLHVLFFSAVI